MYSVMIRIGDARKSKRETFDNSAEAEAYFNKLCERRTDYPGGVAQRVLASWHEISFPVPRVAGVRRSNAAI